jgi:hypothetical protein
MYSLSSVKKAIKQPRSALAELNRIYAQGIDVRSSPVSNERGVDVMSEDWDNLIILDACRFDTFEELSGDLPGTLEKAESKASATTEFLRANFSDRDLSDTVYVTANPQLYRIENGIRDDEPINASFHERIDVWKDQWHDEHRTVMPGDVTEAALKAAEQYPDERLIVHYLQPHAPYIGPTGREAFPTEFLDFWNSFREGEFDISLETVKRAYRENLELVLSDVERLLTELRGRTVVTADHGELLGERDSPIPIRRFGHPVSTNLPAVVEIPWLIHDNGDRPEIDAETAKETDTETEDVDSEIVEKRLEDLGYVE